MPALLGLDAVALGFAEAVAFGFAVDLAVAEAARLGLEAVALGFEAVAFGLAEAVAFGLAEAVALGLAEAVAFGFAEAVAFGFPADFAVVEAALFPDAARLGLEALGFAVAFGFAEAARLGLEALAFAVAFAFGFAVARFAERLDGFAAAESAARVARDESAPPRALPSRLLERRTGRERGRLVRTSPLESSAIG